MMKVFLILLFLVVCGSYLSWHVVHYLCQVYQCRNPGVIAWLLAPPIGTWLVFSPIKR
jgi:hypothetical protein